MDIPTLIMLPGMDGTGLFFAPFIQALGDGVRLKVIDYPKNEPLGYEALESLVVRSLPAEGACVLLGESFSGPIAISLAAALPSRISGLILCCTFARNPLPSLAMLRGFLSLLPPHALPARILGHFLLGRCLTTEWRSELTRVLAGVSPSVLKTRLQAVLDIDVTSRLSAIEAPILYLRAMHDRLVPKSASQIIVKAQPKTRIIELDAPHFLLQTRPTEAAHSIISFMNELESAQHQR